MRFGQPVAIGMMMLSFHYKFYWLFACARALHLTCLFGSMQVSNHIIRTCERIYHNESFFFNFFIVDRPLNDLISFVLGNFYFQIIINLIEIL